MRAPLAGLALCFCLGILAAWAAHCPFILVYSAALLSWIIAFLIIKKSFLCDIALLCFVFLLGAVFLRNSLALPANHILRQLFRLHGQTITIEGVVRSQPVYKINRMVFLLESRKVGCGRSAYACCGQVLASINGKKEVLTFGDTVIARGNLYRPFKAPTAGNNSYRDYLVRQGVYCLMRIRSPCYIKALGKAKVFSFQGFALGLKEKIEEIILKYMAPITASILDAMVLGERKGIPPLVNLEMMQTGTVHILVVSGFNTGLVILVVVLFLKILRIPRRPRIAIALPVIILYCFMTGASTPVVRATIMGAVFLMSYALKREGEIYNSCALALIFILLINPLQLFDVGLELSFASVLSLTYFYPKLSALLRVEAVKNRLARFLAEGGLVSLSAWIGTAGIIAYYFRFFSPVTVLANVFIVPLAAFITLVGVAFIFIAVSLPVLAPYFAQTCEFLVDILLWTNHLFSQIPLAVVRF